MSQSDIQRMSFRLNEVVEEVFGVANLFEYFHTSELPTSIIFIILNILRKDILCQNYAAVTKVTGTVQCYRFQ